MKFKFSLQDKEASAEADIEGLVEKRWAFKEKNPELGKTRYQIRQEEKRKSKEQEQRHFMQMTGLLVGLVVLIIAFCTVMSAID